MDRAVEKTKTRTTRVVPISARLKAMLDMRCCDPAGQPMAPEAYVFGTAIGTRILDPIRAWYTCLLKSHGYGQLTTLTKLTGNFGPEAREALATIDLHFHDLRREAGSRWLEGGVPIHVVRDWLGHTSVAQTSTYLASSAKVQHDPMAAYEARRAPCNAPRNKIATNAGTGGHEGPQTATMLDTNTSKTTSGYNTTVN